MLPTVDLDKLRAFYLVTKYGKFSLAARELGISNGGVTRQVQKLEKQLNCQLLERGGPGTVRLTEKGEVLERLTHDLFRQVAEIQPKLAATDNLLEGNLRIAVHAGYSMKFFSSCIHEFMKENPRIKFEIISSESLFDVDIGETDLVISPWVPESSDAVQRFLFNINLKLYASKSYIEAFGAPERVEDLKDHRLIAYAYGLHIQPSQVNWYLKLGDGKEIKPYITCNNNGLLYNLMNQGLCIGSVSPEFMNFMEVDFIPILPDIQGPQLSIYFVHGQQYSNSQKVNLLYDFLKKKAEELLKI